MKLTVIADDDVIIVDGVPAYAPAPIDPGIHAIQWDGDRGEIEFRDDRGNQEFTDESFIAPFVAAHRAAVEQAAIEEAAAEEAEEEETAG